jgi:[FeFe] hydrogenase H-cluster maturation GTPase HydF
MGLNDTVSAERIQIGFFGMRNVGKSSLVNCITNQELSVVSDVKGTTTDPVKKSMELLPLGPVTVIDTPGYDDEGALGELRVAKTKEILSTCDIAILVTDNDTLSETEEELREIIEQRNVPYLIVHNKTDLTDKIPSDKGNEIFTSALHSRGIEELKNAIAKLSPPKKEIRFVADLIGEGDTVVLVIPIDTSAPKGRIILPQQQAIRDILDANAISCVTGVGNLNNTISSLKNAPALVITDSQAFAEVMRIIPEEIPLTSFSILMARYKGFLDQAAEGAKAIEKLKDKCRILISEGCTHHRQCEDIGTVKLPNLLRRYTGKDISFEFSSGHSFPEDLSSFDLVIHCGACMLGDNEVEIRRKSAEKQGVPFTNYGISIAYMNGILERSIRPLNK